MIRLAGIAVLLVCIAVVGLPLFSASGPSVGAPVLTPSAITAGTVSVVRVSSLITSGSGPAVLGAGVNLLQVDANGNALATLGTLNDNGVNGDVTAGDHVFSGLFTFNQSAPGTIRLQASAAFTGVLRRVRSTITPLEVLPAGVPLGSRYLPNSQIVADASGREMPCDQVLAFFQPGTSMAAINTLVSTIGGSVIGFLPGSQLHTWQIQIPCTSAQGIQSAVNALESSPIVAGAQPNAIVHTTGVVPNDDRFRPCQAGTTLSNGSPCLVFSAAPELLAIHADAAWAITQGLSPNSNLNLAYPGPIIAIVDTGVDYTHEDLSAPGKVIKGRNVIANSNDPMDDFGHGTGVAGVAAADGNNGIGIPGMSWASPIVAEKVLDNFGSGTDISVSEGIQDAVSRGAKIINLSLSNGTTESFSEGTAIAIDGANKAGALVVAGAGNSFCSQREFPAGFSSQTTFGGQTLNTTVLSVGGVDLSDNVASTNNGTQCQPDSGSNFGTWVDLYAPFFAVTAQAHQCQLNGCFNGDSYFFPSGTSFSTPFVSGAAALVWAANPQMSNTDVMNTLISTGDAGFPDPQGNTIVRLNAFTAVFEAAASHCTKCPQAPEVSVAPSDITAGPMVNMGVVGRLSTDLQPQSVHGVSVALSPIIGSNANIQSGKTIPIGYQVGVLYVLNTWDSYICCSPRSTGKGFFDSFSVSTSNVPYWQLAGLTGPLQLFAIPAADPLSALLPSPGQPHTCEVTSVSITGPETCPFDAGLIIGGQNQAGSTFANSLAGTEISLPSAFFFGNGGTNNTWLNFVLDTATPPDSDNLRPSWGVFHVFDITPICLNHQNPLGPPLMGTCTVT